MKKHTYLLAIFLFSYLTIFAQDENQTSVNQEKIEELKARIDRLSGSTISRDSTITQSNGISNNDGHDGEDNAARLARMEEKINLLLQKLENCCCDEKKSAHRIGNKNGEFYVIVESQKTSVLAKKAQQVHKIRSNRDLIILKNKESGWYYLAIPAKQSYRNTVDMINNIRIRGFQDAWWISVDEVEKID